MARKELLEDYEVDKCPKCGKRADWTGGENYDNEYNDNYECPECGTNYSVVYYMNYKYHWIEEE